MKKSSLLFFSLVVGVFLLSGSSNNPPNGRTGAPGDGLCTDCHSGGNPDQDGEIEISGFPDQISPESTYRITVSVRNPNGLGATGGFQVTILDASDARVGAFTNAGENATISSSGGREYFEHNPSIAFPGSNEVSWSVDWTAPDGPLESEVTLYAAGNVSNGNGQSSGDLILTASRKGVVSGTSSTERPVLSNIRVFPNPASSYLNLDIGVGIARRIEIIDVKGSVVKAIDELVDNQVDVSSLNPGLYFLRVWRDGKVETVQWMKR